jgi:hypothetical protein
MRALVLVAALLLSTVAPATAASLVRVTLSTSSERPVAGDPWRYSITARDEDGRKVAARARLHVLRGDVVVGCLKGRKVVRCRGEGSGAWISFTGTRTGVLTWPAQLIGVALAFRATVASGDHILRLRALVRVRPVPRTSASS